MFLNGVNFNVIANKKFYILLSLLTLKSFQNLYDLISSVEHKMGYLEGKKYIFHTIKVYSCLNPNILIQKPIITVCIHTDFGLLVLLKDYFAS